MLLKFAVKSFLDEKQFQNVSKRTLESYSYTLNDFHDFCVKQEIIDVTDVTPTVVKSFLLYCQKQRGNNITSINHKLRNIKCFFNFCQNEEFIFEKQNPTRKIKFSKEDIRIEIFSDSQIRQMLNYYARLKNRDKTFYAYRDYCEIYTLLGTGIRLGELINLKWDNVDFKNGTITVFGKKRQYRSIPVTEKLSKELAEYRVFCEQYFSGQELEFVFTDKKNQQLSPNAIKCQFKRLKQIFNFKNVRLSCHTFRHTFCTIMLKNGCDLLSLKNYLGHSSLAMVNRYYSLYGTALKEQNDKYNPLNNLDI